MLLQFTSFASRIEPGFWLQLSEKKLDEQKLTTDLVLVKGTLEHGKTVLLLDDQSFNLETRSKNMIHGFVKNLNTIEDFKQLDKNKLLHEVAQRVIFKSVLASI